MFHVSQFSTKVKSCRHIIENKQDIQQLNVDAWLLKYAIVHTQMQMSSQILGDKTEKNNVAASYDESVCNITASSLARTYDLHHLSTL